MKDFYAQYGGRLMALCTRYVGNDEDAKDVLQDSVMKMLTHVADFDYRGEGSLMAWATRIVVNQSLAFLRSRHREQLLLSWRLPDEAEDPDPDIDDVPPEVLHRLVSQLPVGYRTVLNLYIFEERSHSEIGQLLGIKPDTSASQLHRAKNQLAKWIRQYRKTRGIR